MEPSSKKIVSLYGRWLTVSEQVATIHGYDLKLHLWYGNLEGVGPTNWDYKGKHLINDQYDLYEPIPEKKEEPRTNE